VTDLQLLLAVMLACGLASVARYGLSLLASRDRFPWPTIAANVAGTAILASGLALYAAGSLGADAFVVLGVGLAGGLTTFSTLAVDAARLWRSGKRRAFTAYLALTLGCGLAASWLAWTTTVAALV